METDSTVAPLGLASLETDLRNVMRSLAEARFLADEQSRNCKEKEKKLLLGIIEVLDAFDRVFRNISAKQDQITPQMKTWIGNFGAVQRALDRLVSECGVSRLGNLDQGFDPHWHQAIETVEDSSHPDGFIVEELKPGYLWRDEILRKSEVIAVSNS